MTLETTQWDITEFLADDAAVAAYLDAVFEAGDPDEMRDALRHVARARGMTELARAAGITRAGLYKALGESGNPSFATMIAIMKALGVKLAAKPAAA
ncbi:addiction module antidote protein [Sphingosinicella sp.]|uniref:addiction module antidote protein n=1 Tax=Sphingosinicella sp. TaxID=1917971 RepID=UPI0040376960